MVSEGIHYLSINIPLIWMNCNDLSVTSLEWWSVRENIPTHFFILFRTRVSSRYDIAELSASATSAANLVPFASYLTANIAQWKMHAGGPSSVL